MRSQPKAGTFDTATPAAPTSMGAQPSARAIPCSDVSSLGMSEVDSVKVEE